MTVENIQTEDKSYISQACNWVNESPFARVAVITAACVTGLPLGPLGVYATYQVRDEISKVKDMGDVALVGKHAAREVTDVCSKAFEVLGLVKPLMSEEDGKAIDGFSEIFTAGTDIAFKVADLVIPEKEKTVA